VAVSHTKLKKLNKMTREWLLLSHPWTHLCYQGYFFKYRGWSVDCYCPTMPNLLYRFFYQHHLMYVMLISLWVKFQLQINQRT